MQTIEETSELLYKALWESKTKDEDVMAITLANDSDHREAIKKYYSAVQREEAFLKILKETWFKLQRRNLCFVLKPS